MNNPNDAPASPDNWGDLNLDDDELQSIVDVPLPSQSKSQLRTAEQHAGFDNNVGETWLYPSNLPLRAYQMSIVKAALFKNTLVVLPTGLGKTFIAAVVMYNIYRWYPTSKIIFMAPTRPLVAQQIEACQRIMPFPDEDTIELTGRIQRPRRAELWRSKRVFFVTPQVVQSDMSSSGNAGTGAGDDEDAGSSTADFEFPFDQVRLIVVDEAHRAKGRYAYTEVVQRTKCHNKYFRVLALSATPGRTMDDIAEVVRNLLISHIEVRGDTSADVMPYIHRRNMKTVVVALSEDVKSLHGEVLEIVDPYLRQLIDANVLSGSLAKISRNFLLFEQKRFRERSQTQQLEKRQVSAISTNFSFCISIYHAVELLERHGMRVFQNYFEEDEEGRNKFVVNMEPRLRRLLQRLRQQLGENPFEISTHPMTNGQMPKIPMDLDFGHPKFEEARKCLLEHFQANPDSRAIVFCEYRESVMLIFRLLQQHAPLLKPRYFVGQGGATGSLRPLTQKEQIQIMQDFRSGKNNILVATSIGEEGIDVGEVELIVCFDINTSNPQRFIQRIGRTGRQKQGNVVVLVTEGREEQTLKEVLAQKNQTNAKIQNSMVVRQSLYKYSPRLVPTELDPKAVHVFIKPPAQNNKNKHAAEKEGKTKNIKKKGSKANEVKTSQDLRQFFKQKTALRPAAALLAEPTQHGLETQECVEKSLNSIDDYFKAFEAPLSTNTQLLASNASQEPTFAPEANHNTPSQTVACIYETERFRNLRKLIQRKTSLVPMKELITDPIEQLRSTKLSDDGKRFLLRAQPHIVSDVLEKLKVLEVLALEPHERTPEERDVRDLYGLIENLLGGSRIAVEMFIDDAEIEEMARQRPNIPADPNEMDDERFKAACDAIFDGLNEQDMLCDNFDYIQAEFKQTDFYKEMHAELPDTNLSQCSGADAVQRTPAKNAVVESMVYETIVEADEDVQSNSVTDTEPSMLTTNCQWDDFAKHAPLANKSTPLPQGPLAKAFQRQQQKLKEKQQKGNGNLLRRLGESCTGLKAQEKAELMEMEVICISESESLKSSAGSSVIELESKVHATVAENVCEAAENEATNETKAEEDLLDELDLDMAAFMEPFPEEESELEQTNASKMGSNEDSTHSTGAHSGSSQKENNENATNIWTPQKRGNALKTPPPTNAEANVAGVSAKQPTTPSNKAVETKDYEKSPSLYEMYLKNMRKRSRLPEHIKQSVLFAEHQVLKASSSSLASEANMLSATTTTTTNISEAVEETVEKSFIRKPAKALKRKLISSSESSELEVSVKVAHVEAAAATGSETECEEFESTKINPTRRANSCNKSTELSSASALETNELCASDAETDCDEIAATQKPKRPLRLPRQRQRQNQRRLHAFIDAEALVSADEDDDEDEASASYGGSQYVKDSMIVSSDEAEASDENAPTATQMHAHYLQTVRSPRGTHAPAGGFKIPAPRVYNDQAQIYSQAVPIVESQYVCDSFVVHEEVEGEEEEGDGACNRKLQNETMSPLTRAERILKERRRQRARGKKFKEVAAVQKRRRIRAPAGDDDSSDDDAG